MAVEVFKLLIFLKRRPGMSLQEFRDYYERVHVKLGEKYLTGVCRYVRRYVQPVPWPGKGATDELDFDVVTEVWFEDRGIFEAVVKAASRDAMPAEVVADEERLFDRARSRYATVIEFESEVPGRAAGRST